MGLGDWHKKVMAGAKGLVAHPPLAVDFGVGSLKVLQVAQGDSPSLVAAAMLPTPDELLNDATTRLAYQIENLPKLVKPLELRSRRAVCAIPASSAIVKHMQFAVEPGATIAQLVQSAIPAQLGCDPAALVYRHMEVGQVGRKTEVICMAAALEL